MFEESAPNFSTDEVEKSTKAENASSFLTVPDEFCSNKSYHEAAANDEKDQVTKEDFVTITKNLEKPEKEKEQKK